MKIEKKLNHRKIWIVVMLILAVFLLLLLAYTAFAKTSLPFFAQDNPSDKTDSSDESKSSFQQNDSEKSDDSEKVIPPNTDHVKAPATDSTTGKQIITVVTSSNQDGSTVSIRGGLDILRTNGICYAELTGPNKEKIRKDTTLLQNPSTTDCKTISVPISELSPGEWNFILKYSAEDAEGQSDVESFTIP